MKSKMMMEEEQMMMESAMGGFVDLTSPGKNQPGQSKYAQLLAVIEELGRDIRPTYAGSKSSAERIKRGIVHARILVRECLMETERSARMACLKMIDSMNMGKNADSVEWCPVEGFRDLVVCATYQLDANTGERSGQLHLLKFEKGPNHIKIVQKLDVPGVLDCKWSHVADSIFLAAVNSVGEIRLYKLLEDKSKLKEISVRKIADDDTLLLSLDWSTAVFSKDVQIVTSDSKGNVHLLNFNNADFEVVDSWKLHNFEAWITAFNYWNTNIFFSGGDDCKLKCFDKRAKSEVHISNIHGAGVTALQYNFKDENCFASGSYDENVIFWDFRQWKNPKGTATPGGGVWRIKWEPFTCKTVATCCMYEGSYIIDPSNFVTLAEYHEHKSINYGIDWSHLDEKSVLETLDEKSESKKIGLLAVCSFYDQTLSFAKYENFFDKS